MTFAPSSLAVQSLDTSSNSELEEVHEISRLVAFARVQAVNLDLQQTVYCLDLAQEQLAAELRYRAENSPAFASSFCNRVTQHRQKSDSVLDIRCD